ncbi:MAG: DUF1287 domain-containing protein [Armatimonadota bacterium]
MKLVASARDQLTWGTVYDARYMPLNYPGGDVARDRGVCTDVVIRAYRTVGLDLQKLIHEDKQKAPSGYPSGRLDPNIDHRRVPNMVAFFRRKGASLPVGKDWRTGDVVWWKLESGLNHVGLVTDRRGSSGNLMVIHNLSKPKEEDCLLSWKVCGHYRW